MQDFATANASYDDVSIRLGDGTGVFVSATYVTVGDAPISIAIGDFNGDGMQDFATANYLGDNVSIRLGDGFGGFTSATDVTVGSYPYSIAIGDFNGDGMQDFATANRFSYNVSIRLGDGTGVFTSATDVSVGDGPRSIAIGDFNGDGMQDFATANYSDYNVSIRLGEAVSITGATEVYVGSSITLTGNGTAATVDPWVSSNTGIATVSSTGEVTGVSVGSTVITYTTDGGCSTNHSLTVIPPAPSNDNICDAILVTVGQTSGVYSNVGASIEAGEPIPPPTSCNVQTGWCNAPGAVPDNTIWFEFVATASNVSIATVPNDWDSQLALWSAANCAALTSGGGTLIAANDDRVNVSPYDALITSVCLTAGETYYVQVDGYDNTTSSNISLLVSDLGTTTWYADTDNDQFGDPAVSTVACSQPANYVADNTDCDDGNALVGPCLLWTGAVSTVWNVSGNWSPTGVPSNSDVVFIPALPSNQPHVTNLPTLPTIIGTVNIQSGAILTVDAGKALTVSDALGNEGTILVKSDAIGIGSLITEGTVTGAGAFQMEQYLTGSGGATPDGLFYYVSSPAVGATASSYAVASGNKLWSADETTQSYAQITNGSTVLNATEGYVARMGGSGGITFDGSSFNTGNQRASGLTRTGTAELNRGYNLVGNPYPSTVSWDAATKTNLEPSMYYRTHQGSSMLYDTYNAVSGFGTNNNLGGAVTGAIPPTQAFWVRVDADGNTGELDFTNAMRSHGTLSGIYRMAAEEGTVRIALSNGTNSDEEIIFFDPSAQDGYDAYDSQKFWAGASVPQIYTSIGIDTLVINGLASTATNPVVDLGVKLPAVGEYTFDATSITLNENVHLEDRYLGIFQDLNAEPTYAFTSSVAGNIPTRFALHFGMAVTGIEDGEVMKSRVYTSNGNQLNIILSENIENGNVQVLDMVGRIVRSANLNASRTTLDMNTATGVYLIRVETEKGTDTHRIVIN